MTLEQQIAEALRPVVREEIRAALAGLESQADRDDVPLDTHQAAELAGVAPKTIRRWVAAGLLTATRHGRELRLRRADVLRARAGVPSPDGWAAAHPLPPRP